MQKYNIYVNGEEQRLYFYFKIVVNILLIEFSQHPQFYSHFYILSTLIFYVSRETMRLLGNFRIIYQHIGYVVNKLTIKNGRLLIDFLFYQLKICWTLEFQNAGSFSETIKCGRRVLEIQHLCPGIFGGIHALEFGIMFKHVGFWRNTVIRNQRTADT